MTFHSSNLEIFIHFASVTLQFFLDSTPEKSSSPGIKYFYHVCKDFLPPYGAGHNDQSFTDDQFAARIGSINCELITRPWIVVSKFADAMLANSKYLHENKDLLVSQGLEKFLKKLDKYKDSLEIINSKSETGGKFYNMFKYTNISIYTYILIYKNIHMHMYQHM